MPQSLSLVVVHLVFSTKDRAPFIEPSVIASAHAYLAEVARNAGCECYRVGGVADHVHVLIRLSRTITLADLVEELKTSSSRWLKALSPTLQAFAWQRGYGAFSVGPRQMKATIAYIDNQEAHHRTESFQDEFRMLLTRHGIDFSETYVWD